MKRIFLFLFPFLLVIFSCSAPDVRTPYVIGRIGDLTYTNSDSFFDLSPPKHESDRLQFGYRIYIKNHSKNRSYEISHGLSTVEVNGESKAIDCRAGDITKKSVSLGPGKGISIHCVVEVTANASNELRRRDTNAQIIIPILGSKKNIQVPYYLRIEDFE